MNSVLKWLPYPMIRIATFFIAGVLAGIYFPNSLLIKPAIGVFAFLLIFFLGLKFSNTRNRFRGLLGFSGLFALFFLGFVRVFLFTDSNRADHFAKAKHTINTYEAVVRNVPEKRQASWKVEAEVKAIKTESSEGWRPAAGKLLLYIADKATTPIGLRYGDKILVNGKPQELRPPANPGEFDFKRFLSFKNISHQQFVKPESVKFISTATRKGFIYYSHLARAWSIEKINEYVHGDDERAITMALVLGVTDGIDNELQNAYAASGAMHVLAVSGLHVGIIYAIILFLFKPLSRHAWSRWLVAITSLVLLWAFAFVTGLSPSVLRAVVMFTFIAAARPFGRQTNIYNTLAASIFILLILDPFLIMSVGFQLSYLAVLGIVYLHRPIYNLWDINNRVGDWIWKITCVSIAAQIATFALSLLYFHQFPTYFLVSNLFVIPLSTLVLILGMFLLLASALSPIAVFTAWILEFIIKILNWVVFKTEDLPLSVINNIHITAFQCWLLIGFLVALVLHFEFKSMRWLYTSFAFASAFALFQWSHFFESVDQRQAIVYSINNHQAIEFIDRGHSYFACDTALLNDPGKIQFHVQPNRLIHGVLTTENQIPFSRNMNGVAYCRWNGKTIAWIKETKFRLPATATIDYLIVNRNALNKNLLVYAKPNYIILDGGNSKRFVNYLGKQMENGRESVRVVAENGAFIFND